MTETEEVKACLEDTPEESVDIVDFSKVQKKKKKKKKKKEEDNEEEKKQTPQEGGAFDLNNVPGHINFDYNFLLDRIEEPIFNFGRFITHQIHNREVKLPA